MSTSISHHRSLMQLTREVEHTETEIARLESERAAITTGVRKAARRMRYLHLAQSIRRPTAQFHLWPFAVMLFGPLLIGIACLILINLVTGSYPLSFFAFLLGIVAGVGLFASFIYHPADTLLPAAVIEAESQSKLASARLNEKMERLAETKNRLQNLLDEQRDQIASGKLQKAALLQRNWKQMHGAEWEDFVVEVCRTLGAKADRTNHVGKANLIVDFGDRRVAVLTEGDGQVLSSDTVQRAIAAQKDAHCDSCAVIINRRFTGAAQDFARRNGCAAIGAVEFPDFAMGKIAI